MRTDPMTWDEVERRQDDNGPTQAGTQRRFSIPIDHLHYESVVEKDLSQYYNGAFIGPGAINTEEIARLLSKNAPLADYFFA